MATRKLIKKQQKGFTKGKVEKEQKVNPGFTHWCAITAIKLSIIFVATLALYSIYLDGKVRHTFEGQRWQVPAQVFGKVPTINNDQQINFDHLEQELLHLHYKRVAKVKSPGQYARNTNKLIIYRREFDFGFGVEAPAKVSIEKKRDEVFRLLDDGQPVHKVKLEPILIDRILSAEGEDRVVFTLDQIPEQLIDTLLFIEDKDFYHHHGLSPTGILRAFWKNILAGETVQGGSTLTQQLAKNMFLTRHKTLWRKVNEAMISIILEMRYSKDQILEAYLNEVYLGQHYANGIHGVGLAAQFYFGKPLKQLESHEIALLIAQIKGPSFYDPWREPKRATERRDLVLRLMFENHLINKNEFNQALLTPLTIRVERRFDKQTYPAYMQLVRRELKQMGAANAMQSGIRIFTGFDLQRQINAERAITQQLTLLEKAKITDKLEAAVLISDIRTGQIQAVVGGKSVKFSGFNRALDAKRPIGSLIKPVVYLTALEKFNTYNFATPLKDEPISFESSKGKYWQPQNYDGKFRGQVPLIRGLVNSLNVPTVNLGMQLGTDNVATTLTTLGYEGKVPVMPSMLLGAINMSAYEVNQWYNTIANNGLYNDAHAIIRVVSGQGDVLWSKNSIVDARLSPQGAYLIDYALARVAKEGTAKSLSWLFPEQIIAGKTGTSNDLRDSWFVGYDQQSVVTTWIGRDDNLPTGLTGSSGALTVFANYLKKQGSSSRFDLLPEGIEFATFELATGNAVIDDCANVAYYPAISDGIFYSDQCLQQRPEQASWLDKIFGSDSE